MLLPPPPNVFYSSMHFTFILKSIFENRKNPYLDGI